MSKPQLIAELEAHLEGNGTYSPEQLVERVNQLYKQSEDRRKFSEVQAVVIRELNTLATRLRVVEAFAKQLLGAVHGKPARNPFHIADDLEKALTRVDLGVDQ